MSTLLKIEKPLVSVNWLQKHINEVNLVVLNGTLPKVTAQKKSKLQEDFQIPGTRFFDLKNDFSIQGAAFPYTVQTPDEFEKNVRKIGINDNACIVVYDEYGIYSSPRVWWLFKAMGFDNIAVLDGGLPAWKNSGFAVESKQTQRFELGNFEAQYQPEMLLNAKQVLNSIDTNAKQLIDARSSGRFYAIEPEPRIEVRGGHIPTSRSLPYSTLVSNGKMKSKKELKEFFVSVNPMNKEMIFSCGSGITACVLSLAATLLGCENNAVYDGSWTEWGSLIDLPIEK